DIFTVDVDSGEIKNITKDSFADYAPTYALDGKSLVYTARVSSNDKLWSVDLATGAKKQLTFGVHDDTGAKFYNDYILVFSSTAIPPTVQISPEVARNANIPNIWTLDLRTNDLRQWTDTVTGNISPIVLHTGNALRVAFI